MKLVLTGCTGFIGSEVLSQCLRNPAITSIIALSRRCLPDEVAKNPKFQVILMRDFTAYPDSVLRDLSGADAAIWCMGTTAGDRALEHDYPVAFGSAFSKTLASSKKQFRYVHLSGAATERDQEKPLWFKGDMRKMKGAAESEMLAFAKEEGNDGLWQTVIVKAGFVVSKDGRSPRDLMGWVLGTSKSIRVDELAAAMIDIAINWSKQDTLQDCQAMVMKGREALKNIK
ncbi:hypothetical protein D0Z07_3522 [Hyphodiscus hymeniophilus]|uniref:NAD(P)-binding domain-containing protein n=1 Tax=Hyphodiscus hymeniophilus TaxID=353542 RepID=A0A9P7AYJ7_9HELO|nr:hypothetical protein D0Z07_3522 [Hyphodiscus hymeniophilus]